jgi:hypothetical protein
MVPGYRSGAKIAEAPTLVNSNNAEISKNTPPHGTANRNSLFFCDAPENIPSASARNIGILRLTPYKETTVTSKKNIMRHRPDL